MRYHIEPLLAPSAEVMQRYRGGEIDWGGYTALYVAALDARDVAQNLDRPIFAEGAVLLCSEATPEHCHRRLAAEYLAERWPGFVVGHL